MDRGEGGLALRLDAAYEPAIPESAVMVREYLHLEIPFDPLAVKEVTMPGTRLKVESGEFMTLRDEQLKRYQGRFRTSLGRWDRQLPRRRKLA